eukprot:TRINITY_DN15825_c0_g1_i2.p1 TRINITY_DN15825_c0_g1~~TRINITY_DN15825_c0_g1_i2.p1  ORF type:complete len:942 (+),score=122.33 TRINITY_DN15825_c0_g1_i2:38-2863(+)
MATISDRPVSYPLAGGRPTSSPVVMPQNYKTYPTAGGRITSSPVVMPQNYKTYAPAGGRTTSSSPAVMPQNYTAWPRIGMGPCPSSAAPISSGLPSPSGSFVVSNPYAGTSFAPLSGTPTRVPTPVSSQRGPAIQWGMPGAAPSHRSVTSAAPQNLYGAAASGRYDEKSKEDWLAPIVRNLWPNITAYLEEMVKAKLGERHIYVDSSVHSVMTQLSKYPPPIPFGKDWLNILLRTMWPLVKQAAEKMIQENMLPLIREKLPSFMQSIDINPCSLGGSAPQVKWFRILDKNKLGTDRWLGLHLMVEYDGDADIGIVYHGMRAGVKHIKAHIEIFINFAGQTDDIPFVKGLAVNVDNLGFSMDWTGAADFLDNKFIEDVIHNIAKRSIQSMAVLPERIAVSLQPMGAGIFDLVRPRPKGFLKIELVGITGLKGDEISLTTFMGGGRTVDPFVELSIGSQFWKSTTVSRCLDPEWEEDNTFIFFMDSPGHQVLDIRVFDEDLTTSIRRGMGGNAADTIARALDLRMHELLVRADGHDFKDEIRSDLMIGLALWWPGQGKGPGEEDMAKDKPDDNMTEAEKVQASKESREETEEQRHKHAREEIRKRHEAFEKGQRALQTDRDASVLTRMTNWFKYEAAEASEWVREEAEYVMEGAGHLMHVVKDEAMHLKDVAMEKVHTHNEANEQARKEALLAANARIHLRFHWRPLGDATKAGKLGRGGPTLHRMLHESPSVSVDSDAEAPEWPAYALLVGIAKVAKVVHSDSEVTEFYVQCDVTPTLSQDGKLVFDSEDIVTKRKSAVMKPRLQSLQGLTHSGDESGELARKVKMCLRSGMPVSSVADVLDLDEGTVLKAFAQAVPERNDCVDIEFNEDFVYLLHVPEAAVINLEVFRNDRSIGTRSMCVGPLLEKPGMTEDFEQLPVDNPADSTAIARVTGRVQLWPVGK